MKRILALVQDGQRHFAEEAFFRRLEGRGTVVEARAFIPHLTFFVMGFQDILRLNAEHVRDPAMRAVAERHRREDQGHEAWFLSDLRRLCGDRDIGWMFGPACALTRDCTYALAAEVFRARSDAARLALLLVLEATGDVFFSRIPAFFDRAGFRGSLDYFSRGHHQVERDHVIFEAHVWSDLERIPLDEEAWGEASTAALRCFGTMSAMVRGFETRVVEALDGVRPAWATAVTGDGSA